MWSILIIPNIPSEKHPARLISVTGNIIILADSKKLFNKAFIESILFKIMINSIIKKPFAEPVESIDVRSNSKNVLSKGIDACDLYANKTFFTISNIIPKNGNVNMNV